MWSRRDIGLGVDGKGDRGSLATLPSDTNARIDESLKKKEEREN